MGSWRILNNYSVFILGFVSAIILSIGIPLVESAIPPTPAWKIITGLNDTDSVTYDNVKATLYNDQVYYVTDGSIHMTITDSYP